LYREGSEINMGFGLNDLTSMFSKDGCKDGKRNNIILLIITVLIICGCSGKGFGGSFGSFGCCDPCGKSNRSEGGLFGGIGIIILILLLCGGNNGIAGFGSGGNLNTNIINLERDSYDDEYL
jgi:hypothetical protein